MDIVGTVTLVVASTVVVRIASECNQWPVKRASAHKCKPELLFGSVPVVVIGSNSRAASQGFHLRTAHPLGFLAPGHE